MASPSPVAFPLRVACVDVGSNGIRCVAAEFADPDHHRILLEDRVPVRLGHSVFLDGAISKEAMDQAVRGLQSFRNQLEALQVRHVRAVATSAVREAANRKQFLQRSRAEAGLPVEVISGAEEARLVHAAVAHRITLGRAPWMLVDLGGGSVEVSLVDKDGMLWSESHPMGTVRLLEEFHALQDDPKRFQKLIEDTVETLRLPSTKRSRRPAGLAATGGNIEELARLAKAEDGEVFELSVKKLRDILEDLADVSGDERMGKFGLRPDRADVIVPAGLIYEQVARLAGVDRITVPMVGLKEGVLHDLVDALAVHTDPDVRLEHIVHDAAVTLGRRYQFEESHGVQVGRLAVSLFDQWKTLHRLGGEDRVILLAAAILHDAGRLVGDKKHHKHSYYLVSEADLPGLGPAEVEIAAQVARYHRKAEPDLEHEPYARLSNEDRNRVLRLAAVLRVADALDREHRNTVQEVRARREGGKMVLHLKGDGEFLLEQWAVQEKGALFERAFGLPLEIRREGA